MIVRIERRYGKQWQSGTAKSSSALRRVPLPRTALRSRGFTLVELILVMTLLVVGVSFISPHLGGFFRGRTLNSEARRMISLSRLAQSRAVSGGVPMILWVDKDKNQYGIQEEPGYHDNDKDQGQDPRAEEYDVNVNLKIEIPDDDTSVTQPMVTESSDPHMNLPHITFLPDGTIADGSPKSIRIADSNNGPTLLVTQTRDRSQYEIGTTQQQ